MKRTLWVIAAALVTLAFQAPAQVAHRPAGAARDQRELPEVHVVSFVLDDVQKNWDRVLPEQEKTPYHHATLVLFRNSYPSPCGRASQATGPFYCPGNEKVYLDLEFFNELKRRFGAPHCAKQKSWCFMCECCDARPPESTTWLPISYSAQLNSFFSPRSCPLRKRKVNRFGWPLRLQTICGKAFCAQPRI